MKNTSSTPTPGAATTTGGDVSALDGHSDDEVAESQEKGLLPQLRKTDSTVRLQKDLVDLLKEPKRVYAAVLKDLYKKEYAEAGKDAKELWRFVYQFALKSVMSKQDRDATYGAHGENLTKEQLMEKVSVSDEAMIIMIVVAKAEEVATGAVSDLDSTTVTGGSSSSNTTVGSKRKDGSRNHGGGRKKRVKGPSEAKNWDSELGTVKNQKAYANIHNRILKARTTNSRNDDTLGWYAAAMEILSEQRQETETFESTMDRSIGGFLRPRLESATDASDIELEIPCGYELCPVAREFLEEERRRTGSIGSLRIAALEGDE